MNNNEKLYVNDENIHDIVKSEIERLGNEADLNHIITYDVTDMSGLFENTRFNGDISKWNVSFVKDMSWMFHNSLFNGDISNWDVSRVVDMRGMFAHSQFNGDLEKWDFTEGRLKYMANMFRESKFSETEKKLYIKSAVDAEDYESSVNYNHLNFYGGKHSPNVYLTPEYRIEERFRNLEERLYILQFKAEIISQKIKEQKNKVSGWKYNESLDGDYISIVGNVII